MEFKFDEIEFDLSKLDEIKFDLSKFDEFGKLDKLNLDEIKNKK